jgi:hypothetical protein
MSNSNIQAQETQHLIKPVIVILASNPEFQIVRTARICWNTGEEKIAYHATLEKDAKPKLNS